MPDINVALVSAPWPLFNRPSIQLGAIKAFLQQQLPQVKVSCHHLYLDYASSLGYPIYEEISQSTWLAEPIAAALLYPENLDKIQRLWRKKAARSPACKGIDFLELCSGFQGISQEVIKTKNWKDFHIIGFSICFSQLTSTIYLIRLIKKLAPSVPVVVGGPGCSGQLGASLLRTFHQIDYVIQGEGERPMLELLKSLFGLPGGKPLSSIAGLLTRHTPAHMLEQADQIPDLNLLPIPDFADYFDHLEKLPPGKKFLPKIPLEISRGCWWKNAISLKSSGGCAFCNLNIQWRGYRHKSPEKVKQELKTVTQKYENLSISFMDNILPPKKLKELFNQIASMDKDFRLFCEIRATTSLDELKNMARAGIREVQVGIEGLSTSLLKKINKGTRAIDNLEIMKNCEIPGLPHITGNLIMEFPSSDEGDVDETLKNLDFAMMFRPLKAIPFWLGYGSPVWQNPSKFGIRRISNHPYYKALFPEDIFSRLVLIVQHYQGRLRHQKAIWKPVKEKVQQWHEVYAKLHEAPCSLPILYYEDGGDFLIIHHRRIKGYDMTHKLKGTSRKIYLFCETQRRADQIFRAFPNFTQDQILSFLKTMVEKKLMFQEGDRFLSLAVPLRP